MFSKEIVTLNIEANGLRFLRIKGEKVWDWGSMPLAPGLVKDGLVTDPAKVSLAINELFLQTKIPHCRTIASLTGLRSVPRIFRLPRMNPKLLKEAIRNESEQEMPVPLEELYLSWQLLDATDSEQQLFVLGVPRKTVDTLVKTLVEAGIGPHVVNLKSLALAKAVNREEALIIDLEPESFDLVVVVGGIPTVMRTIISRGELMTTEDRIRQLASELSQTIEFHNGSHPEHPVDSTTPVFLTGLLANDAAVRDLVGAAIDNPIETLAPAFECPPNLPVAEYAVNIGLALDKTSSRLGAGPGSVHPPVVSPNVLPHIYKRRRASPTRILYPVVAVLLVVLLVFMYQMKTNSEAETTDIQAELNRVNKQIDVVSQHVATINGTEAKADSLYEGRESVLGAGSVIDGLQGVLNVLPSEVRLASVTGEEGQLTLVGDADDSLSVTNYIAALEEKGMFSAAYVASLSGGSNGSPATFSIVCVVS